MRANEILVGTNDVVVHEYLVEVHLDLALLFDSNGVFIMDKSQILEFIPFSNILNVVNISANRENTFYITYKNY